MSLFSKCLAVVSLFLFLAGTGSAQQPLPPDVQEMQQAAFQYIQGKDYNNAIMILTQAVRKAPGDVSLRRDLAYAYYLAGDPKKGEEVITPVLKSDFADEQTFQVASAIENVNGKSKNAKKILSQGIKKYPQSGLLYNSLANLYQGDNKEKDAIKYWQAGIRADPGYDMNYYGAARYFESKGNYVWALLYGEIFLNLNDNPVFANNIKKTMITSYQAFFSKATGNEGLPEFGPTTTGNLTPTTFENCFTLALQDGSAVLRKGINTETLTMLRMRFLNVWQRDYASKYPFSLFSWESKIAHAGYFDAYNQWLFGATENPAAFRTWTEQFKTNFSAFQKWAVNNPLKPASYDPQPQ